MGSSTFYYDIKSITPANSVYMIPKILIKTIANIFSYVTVWAVLFHVLYHVGLLRDQQFSLLILSITVSVLGALITYYHPKKASLPYFGEETSENNKYYLMIVADTLFHQLPLLILLYRYDRTIPFDNLIFVSAFATLYRLLYKPSDIYLLETNDPNLKKKSKVVTTIIDVVFLSAFIIFALNLIYLNIKSIKNIK